VRVSDASPRDVDGDDADADRRKPAENVVVQVQNA
jgi:hypothetical protein